MAQTAQRSCVTIRSGDVVLERALVERVEVLAGGDARSHDLIDLCGGEPFGERAVRDDRQPACLGGMVALERDSDDRFARADREQDLGRGRQE